MKAIPGQPRSSRKSSTSRQTKKPRLTVVPSKEQTLAARVSASEELCPVIQADEVIFGRVGMLGLRVVGIGAPLLAEHRLRIAG